MYSRQFITRFSSHLRQRSATSFRSLSASTVPSSDDDHGSDTKQPGSQRQFREHRKMKSFDDFFANLGSSKTRKSSRRRSLERSRKSNASAGPSGDAAVSSISLAAEDATTTTTKVDMSAFFDEVNKVMEERKKKDNTAASGPSTNTTAMESLESSSPTSTTSILDLMPPVRQRSPSAYEEYAYDQYFGILDFILNDNHDPAIRSKRYAKLTEEEKESIDEWLRAEEPRVKCELPVLDVAMSAESLGKWDVKSLRETLWQQLGQQQKKFMEHQGWNEHQYDLAMKRLKRLVGLCAKKATGPPAEIAWEKMKEAGCGFGRDVLQSFLYITATFSSGPSSSHSTWKGASILDLLDNEEDNASQEKQSAVENNNCEKSESVDIANEVATVHDILCGASEQSTVIRVRRLVALGMAKQAEQLLESNGSEELRLRTYEPVYQCYLEQNDIPSALKLFVKMIGEETVHLRPETHIQLMSGIAENGFFRVASPPIEGAHELGYPDASGPKLFDRLAEELAENTVDITAAAAKRLYNALVKGFENHGLKRLHILQSLETCREKAGPADLVASRVLIDETTGQCGRTGVHLRLINLEDSQKLKLKEGLLYLAATAYCERTGKKDGSEAAESLRRFGDWLALRDEKPFTAIVECMHIDGANVGYYFQNFDEGRFNFHQIEFVVETLEKMGENVLVILPKKYTNNTFMLLRAAGPKRQTLTRKEIEIRNRLISSGKTHVVPTSFLDDYYWMYASVSGQGNKFLTEQQYIAPNNAEGRWPGIRPMLVSNDKMRDHQLSLLEPRLFRRWYSNFLVNFTFSAFVGDQCPDKEIGFKTADFYSREIQGNRVTDESESGHELGTTWHFPVSDWEENESFCVRLPTK